MCLCLRSSGMGAFVMHKRVRMKESKSVDKCFSFSEIPVILTPLSEQITLVLKTEKRASLVAQCLRIRLPMQGTQVQALVWEDPTCRGATKPMHHNY